MTRGSTRYSGRCRFPGRGQQYVGRLHRLHEGKRFVQVYDYVDPNIPMRAKMYERRLRGYAVIGYTVEQPLHVSSVHATD